jgi:formylglycine-generating enzyme required for sulfatase activity
LENRHYRLPTEAEWEFACRSGTKTVYNFGDILNPAMANYNPGQVKGGKPSASFRGKTLPVKTLPPNPWGLYDMHGNVAEWCLDFDYDYPHDHSVTVDPRGLGIHVPTANLKLRAVRGGSWAATPELCRSGYRWHLSTDSKGPDVGFRVVLEP